MHGSSIFRTRLHSSLAIAASGALALSGLAVGPASANAAGPPVFDQLSVSTWGGTIQTVETPAPNCAEASGVSSAAPAIPFADNNTITTQSSAGVTVNRGGDRLVGTIWERGTARAVEKNGVPSRLRLDFTGSLTAAGPAEVSNCGVGLHAGIRLDAKLTTARPLWATVSHTISAGTYVYTWIERFATIFNESRIGKDSRRTSILLAPGTYTFQMNAATGFYPLAAEAGGTSAGYVQIAFARPGSAISKPSGKAQSYAALAAARSCSTHTMPARLSMNLSRIKKVAKVAFSVNGKTVKTLKGKALKRGSTVRLRVADNVNASVRTTVTLKTGKKVTAKAKYWACTR